MYSRQGGISPPQTSRGNEAPTSRRGIRVFGLIFGLCALALMNTNFVSSRHRALAEARKLCRTVFDYPEWSQYWEDIFGASITYDGSGDRSLLPNEPNNIGYFLTLTSCPDDGYPGADTNDPGHAFYDAAALLKYSIFRNTYPAGSKYNATMYAIVHPNAVRCKDPNGVEYDRVTVLQDLGYHITILGSPAYQKNMQGYVLENIDEDAGERDFTRLRALTFDNHPAVVLVGFDTLMMKPIDNIYDDFINDPNQKARYTVDYPTNLPSTGSNSGPSMHWVMLKPDPAFFDTLVDSYLSTEYSPTWGWNYQGVRDFDGILGVKGFLSHYFTRVEPGKSGMLERCAYGNDNSDPLATDPSGNSVCRDPYDCRDCRDRDIDSTKVIKIIQTCGKPWECTYDETWDATTKSACEDFHRSWFSARVDFEESCWLGGPPSFRTGTFHPDVFMGFCDCEGFTCYDRMIDDKAALAAPAPIPAPAPAPIPVLAQAASPGPTSESLSHGVCQDFAVHARTTVTFDGVRTTVHDGDVGVSPGTSITGDYEIENGKVDNESLAFAASVTAALAAAIVPRADGKAMAIEMGGITFTPGTYRSGSAINFAYGSVVTLDGLNEANPVFLFQAGSTLVTAADTYFIMKNGAKAENVLWALGSAATLGANSVLEGSILAGTAITFGTQSELHGCALAQSAITFESEGSVVATHYTDVAAF